MENKNNVYVDIHEVDDLQFNVTATFNDSTDTGNEFYYHIYRAQTLVEKDDGVYPYVLVSYIKNQVEDHNDILEDMVPTHEFDGETLVFSWVDTLDHKPSEQEWDSYY